MQKDILIVGGGPAGYTAAICAAQKGRKATLIDRDGLGGTCLNRGCIPTKALYRSAEFFAECERAQTYGVKLSSVEADFSAMMARKDAIVTTLRNGVAQLLRANGVEVIRGAAAFAGAHSIAVNGEEYTAEQIIIASGSKPVLPPICGMDLDGVIDSTGALSLECIPKSIVIIGGGVIGIELAGIFAALHTEVTIVELLDRILMSADGDVARFAQKNLQKRGVRFSCGTRVESISRENGGYTVYARTGDCPVDFPCETVICCVGRTPDLDGLNLHAANIAFDRKGISVDEYGRTNVPGVYAVGDATGGVMLAHAASEQAKAAIENICGGQKSVKEILIPNCVFTFPEIAFAGQTEEQLKADGIDYRVSKFYFAANGKALALGEKDGFVKVIAEPENGAIRGVHIAGPHASDLIHEAVLGMNAMLLPDEIGECVHAHPTLAEAFAEAVNALSGRAIHLPPNQGRTK